MNSGMHFGSGALLQSLCLLGAGLVASATVAQAETAYAALETIGHKYGEESLERIVTVQGNSTAWTVSLLDPNSPTQLSEIRVRKGRVVSKSAEASAGRTLTPIDLDQLNLDSDGALKLATRHLQRAIPASRVDYTLSTDGTARAPVWVLKLRDSAAKEPTFVQISARDGTIVPTTPSPAPIAAVSGETTVAEVAGSVAARSDEPARVPESTRAASDELGDASSVDVLPQEPSGVPPRAANAAVNEEGRPATQKFQARRSSTRSKSRGSSPPAVVERVADKVERKARFVRRLLPF
jgi:hypothetical protein